MHQSPGLDIPPLRLGSYGDPALGSHGWTLDEAKSRPFSRKPIELGISFFETGVS